MAGLLATALGTVALFLPASALAVGSITEFGAGLQPHSSPRYITTGPDNNLWFTDAGAIGRATPGGAITEFSAGLNPESEPIDIVAGPDGNLWFTDNPWETGTPAIGRITPTGTIAEFSAGQNQDADPIEVAEPVDIVTGPDGNLWFTDSTFFYDGHNSAIGRITPTGTLTEFEMPAAVSTPQTIVTGPDGNLWFTDPSRGPFNAAIGRITPTGTVTEFSTSATGAPRDLVVGPDGNLWFTAKVAIGRITPAGVITAFSGGLPAEPNLGRIIVGPDGALWFIDEGTQAIGKVTTGGTITEFPIPKSVFSYEDRPPRDIVAGPDGNLWFLLDEAETVDRITPAGTITEFSTGFLPGSNPIDIVPGPSGGNLWLTVPSYMDTPAIARVATVGPAGVSPDPALSIEVGGNGSGSVTSVPGGVGCPGTCSSQFSTSSSVSLIATPDAGSTFTGWGGGERPRRVTPCEGVSTGSCTFTMNGDKYVTAEFQASGGSGGEGGSQPHAPSGQSQVPPSSDPTPKRRNAQKPLKCRKGFKKRRVHGKAKCVRDKKKRQ